MIRRLGRRSGAAVVLLTALFAVVPASAAGAKPVITVSQPGNGATVDTPTFTLAGEVATDSGLTSAKDVSATVGGKSLSTVNCTETPCRFSWSVTLPLNGPYQATVTASDVTLLLGTRTTATETRRFSVAAAPARPVLDPPKVNDARNVDLSWSRNTEGDMLYYAVFRRDPGSSAFRQVGGKVLQPSSGTRVSFTDMTTNLFNGGDYAYRVVAVRKGASGTADTEVTSDPSASGAATVPPPPTTTTTAPPPGSPAAIAAGAAGAGPTTTAKPGPPAGVDLTGFLSSRSQAAPVAPITVPEPPDPGFKGTLPFGARPPGDDVEEGDAEAVPPTHRQTTVATRIADGRPLVPVAGGLILLLLAMHVRLLNRRVKAAPAGDLPVVAPPAPAPVAAVRIARPEGPPRPEVYDFEDAEAADEEDWRPVAAIPDPVDEEEDATSLWAPPDDLVDADFDDLDADADFDAGADFDDRDDVDELDDELDDELVALVDLVGPDSVEVDEEEIDEIQPGADTVEALDDVGAIDEIEVFEVVSPTRRRLARAGSR